MKSLVESISVNEARKQVKDLLYVVPFGKLADWGEAADADEKFDYVVVVQPEYVGVDEVCKDFSKYVKTMRFDIGDAEWGYDEDDETFVPISAWKYENTDLVYIFSRK